MAFVAFDLGASPRLDDMPGTSGLVEWHIGEGTVALSTTAHVREFCTATLAMLDERGAEASAVAACEAEEVA